MIATTIVLLAGALPLRMAAIFTSTVSERAEYIPFKRLDNETTITLFNDHQEQAPMLPKGGTLRVQRKRGKVSLFERVD
jgi:hypothetical protein